MELPPGFVLDQPAAAPADTGLPPGFVLDSAPAPADGAIQPATKTVPGLIDTFVEKFNTPPQTAMEHFSLPRMLGEAYRSTKKLAGVVDTAAQGNPVDTDEAIKASVDFIGNTGFSMRSPATRIGTPATVKPTERVQAANTAAELGAPLPSGLVSPTTGVAALTQASRQFPLVGAKIDSRLNATVDAAGKRTAQIADELTGGVTDRATAGAMLRPSLKEVIESNNAGIDQIYGALRHVINPEAVTTLPRTRAILDGIIQERINAGQVKPRAGLEDALNLVDKGASFNGLQRARSELGNAMNSVFAEANPGFSKGDSKRLYAAMSADMEHVVQQNAIRGVRPEQARTVLREANDAASKLIERNKPVQQILGIKADEKMIGSVIAAAQDKTGNARLIAQLRQTMPPEEFQKIGGVALAELGESATGFSLAHFSTKWDKLGDRARDLLFVDRNHRRMLDDIARLGREFKLADTARNTSNTGRVQSATTVIGTLAGAAGASMATASGMPLVAALGALGGGYALASYLAKPATAASIARYMRAQQAYDKQPSAATRGVLNVTSRNLVNNIPALQQQLQAPSTETSR